MFQVQNTSYTKTRHEAVSNGAINVLFPIPGVPHKTYWYIILIVYITMGKSALLSQIHSVLYAGRGGNCVGARVGVNLMLFLMLNYSPIVL